MTRVQLHLGGLPPPAPPSATERFTRALVAVTRGVWNPASDFDAALGVICKTAATALHTERVSIWERDPEAEVFRLLHVHPISGRLHEADNALQTVVLNEDAFLSSMTGVRTIETVDVDTDATDATDADSLLRAYVQSRRIRSMLIAPVHCEDVLQAVICHESGDRVRKWTQEEITFAASMGDYVAMAYEIARRRNAEAKVEHLRLHDRSTGLGNRDYMVELLRQRLASPRRRDASMTVVHVLIDASAIASSAGASTLEEVMARIALRLSPLASDRVELARVHENGFAFLLADNATERSAIRLTERILDAVRTLELDENEVVPAASVGIAFAQGSADNDARVLMRQAEEAAEHARAGDKFGFEIFDPDHHDALMEHCASNRNCAMRSPTASSRCTTSPSTTHT